MKKLLLILFVLIFNLGVVPMSYGRDIPTTGKWGNKVHRTIVQSPPLLSIEKNVLSVQFVDPLEVLTVRVLDPMGMVVYECVISGDANDLCNIVLTELEPGIYVVNLSQQLGVMDGYFEIR